MARKAVSIVLFLAIGIWAELAMAPMLAMHAGHMRPGRETVADMPASHGGHRHADPEQAQMDRHRPCCPGLHKDSALALELFSTSPACDDPHSCCFRQGPQSVPAPAGEIQRINREVVQVVAAGIAPSLSVPARVSRPFSLSLSPPLDVFGMSLRV